MSDDSFVSRWSRMKRQSAQLRKAAPEAEAADAAAGERRTEPQAEAQRAEPVFDPASLPSIESIVAGSDIRAFLQKGVPAELAKAALRRAWTSDPAIRDFIGLAENQWDFTDPASIPGFGPIEATDNIGQLVAQAMGKLPDVSEAVGLSHAPQEGVDSQLNRSDALQSLDAPDRERSPAIEAPVDVAAADSSAEKHPEPVADCTTATGRRGHGRALPR